MQYSNLSKVAGVGIFALLGSTTAHAQQAPSASLYANGVTGPAGIVQIGNYQWVSDHLQGFCRLDDPEKDGTYTINETTCNTSAVSPGQASYDPNTNYVYVPDNSSKSQGVWRLKIVGDKVATRDPDRPTLLAPGKGLANLRTTATALSNDGSFLYVGSIKSGDIKRVANPSLAATRQTVQTIGKTSDGRGLSGITLNNNDLYLAEGDGVTIIPQVRGCRPASPCFAEPLTSISTIAPMAITTDSNDSVYVADITNEVLKYSISDDEVTQVYNGAFRIISGLGLNADKNKLLIGDDPTDGDGIAKGRVWAIDNP